jgi:4,4'-diaponeurosporenoate glycosyltransferase
MHDVWGLLGLAVMIFRLGPRRPTSYHLEAPPFRLTVIIPARNEAQQIGRLLASLPPQVTVRVVDDHSQDDTAAIAQAAGAEVIVPPPLPPGWNGKTWACYCGAQNIETDWLLFMDADTQLWPEHIGSWLAQVQAEQLDMSCPLPWHQNPTLWEQASGAFHLLYLVATTLHPHPHRLYANGQCLLIRQQAYAQIGHGQVRGELAEDLAMAQRCLQQGLRYGLYQHPAYQVRMYPTWRAFVQGWKRNLRLGMGQSPVGAILETTLVMLLLLGQGGGWAWGLGILLVLSYQRRFGDFAPWGALCSPLAVLTFMGLSLLAQIERLRKRPIIWKDRSY